MASDPPPFPAINRFITEQMALGRTPGLAVAILRDGEIAMQRGYGYADIGSREPMTERTGVVIGSTTKALTCAAVLQLADQGKLTLDDPIQRHIPWFRVADTSASARMTVRHAITHTAGLPPSAADNTTFLFSDDDADDALERHVRSLSETAVLWQPGDGWLYANDGFVIAGLIIQTLSGLPYEEYMRRYVLAPLGLTDTAFGRDDKPGLYVATPYDYDADGQPYPSFFAHNRASAAAGSQLIMSARDAGRWLRTMIDGGRLEEGRLLSGASYDEMVRPQAAIADRTRVQDMDANEAWYGLGWMIGRLHDTRTISHGGATITMGSQFILAPDERLGVAVVSNSVTDVSAIVGEGVLSLLLGREPRRSFPRIDPTARPDQARLRRLVGTYRPLFPQNKVTGPWTIALDGERLRVRTYPGDSRRRPGDIFLLPSDDTNFVLFGRGRTGGIARFEVDGDDVRGTWEGVPIEKITGGER